MLCMVAIGLETLRDVCCSSLQKVQKEYGKGDKRPFRVCCSKRHVDAISLPWTKLPTPLEPYHIQRMEHGPRLFDLLLEAPAPPI